MHWILSPEMVTGKLRNDRAKMLDNRCQVNQHRATSFAKAL
jgi:hypothetical protein